MARRKEDVLDRLLSGMSLRGTLLHPGTLFLLGTGLTIFGALNLWEKYQHRIVPAAQYELTEDKVQISPPPAWAQIDLKKLLLERPLGQPAPNILDTDVVARAAASFKSVGWVKTVEQVRKTADGLEIDLQYRQPVGMVELNHTTISAWAKSKTAEVMPIDQAGVVMPAQLLQHVNLPRITVFQPQYFDRLTVWTAWPDERIMDAAQILSLLGPDAARLGIYRVMTKRHPLNTSTAASIPFELWPKPKDSGTKVIWGNSPSKESVNEASAEQKLRALIEFVQQHGPLDKMVRRRVDVRSGTVVIAQDAHMAEKENVMADLK